MELIFARRNSRRWTDRFKHSSTRCAANRTSVNYQRLACLPLQASRCRRKKSTGEPTAHALARYRCFLPDLAGLAGLRRVGPGTCPRISSASVRIQRREKPASPSTRVRKAFRKSSCADYFATVDFVGSATSVAVASSGASAASFACSGVFQSAANNPAVSADSGFSDQ